jgi:hypothetical protein
METDEDDDSSSSQSDAYQCSGESPKTTENACAVETALLPAAEIGSTVSLGKTSKPHAPRKRSQKRMVLRKRKATEASPRVRPDKVTVVRDVKVCVPIET